MMKHTQKQILIYLYMIIGLVACNGEHHQGHHKSTEEGLNDVSCDDATTQAYVHSGWVRPAGKGRTISAAYMAICNSGTKIITIKSASSPIARTTELHLSSRDSEGRTSMQPISQLDIPANSHVQLKPGGYHFMLIGLTDELIAGSTIPINVKLNDGTSLRAELKVKGNVGNDHSNHH